MKYGRLDAFEAVEFGYVPATVLLDGEPVNNVFIVDDVEGEIVVYESDSEGHILMNESGNGANTKTFKGDVVYIPGKLTPISQGKNLYVRQVVIEARQ